MHRITRHHACSIGRFHGTLHKTFGPSASTFKRQTRPHATVSPTQSSYLLPCLEAPELGLAQHLDHVRQVSQQLEQTGMLKIRLGFHDRDSNYLQQLLFSLHKHYKHQLPISHSATRGWFWDVRPSKTLFQAGNHQARSETMDEFPWHTDCSYEDPPPRYFALQVLQHDRYGGGTLSVMNVDRLSEFLSLSTREALRAPEYRISIPAEFIKDPNQKHIIGTVFGTSNDSQTTVIRFREDILEPLTERAHQALAELKETLLREEAQAHSTVHLKATDLPKGSIILMDNRRWLHSRNHINDPERHLRRVRWDVRPFDSLSEIHTCKNSAELASVV